MLSSTTTKPRSYSPATVTELATLTTPFLQPPGCESHWTLTSAPISLPANELRGNSSSTPISTYSVLLVSKHVASCHPSGWDRILPPRVDTLHFYPGVCPSAWTYYSMAAPSSQALSSTAFCCNSGFTFVPSDYNPFSMNGIYECTRTATSGDQVLAAVAKASPTNTGPPMDNSIVMAHKAWALTWEEAHRSTMTPKPPKLTNQMLVPTWTPGEVIPKGVYDRGPPPLNGLESAIKYYGPVWFWSMAIGIPLISILLISCCVCCCVRKRKSNRRKRMAATRASESVVQPAQLIQ